jgi:hypothetical protein
MTADRTGYSKLTVRIDETTRAERFKRLEGHYEGYRLRTT